LNGLREQTFSPAAANTTEFKLLEDHIDRIDFVNVNGTATTAYTADLTNGKVTLSTGVGIGQETVDIGWKKGDGDRSIIEKMRRALVYGGANKSRVHFWGNPDHKNKIYYTGLTNAAKGTIYIAQPSAEYFPENSWNEVGSAENAVTDMCQQYDRALVFTEADTYYTYYEVETNNNISIPAFPIIALNSEIGNSAIGQSQLVNNNPYVLYNGVYKWVNTQIKDERNAMFVSQRIQADLQKRDLSKAITLDNNGNQYWIAIGKEVWIYNYLIDVWYKFQLNDNVTGFIIINKEIYFATDTGTIMKFGGTKMDNGTEMMAEWQMAFNGFEQDTLMKYINRCWFALEPTENSRLDIYWETDKQKYENKVLDFGNIDFSNFTFNINPAPVTIGYHLFSYKAINYKNWTYKTNQSPQPFRRKIKAKKFTYFKLILKNNSLYDGATVLSINFKTRFGGESK
jgi:hypothetical protein